MSEPFFTLEDLRKQKSAIDVKLSERFITPPFSVFDARQGYWQTRKRLWVALGIKGEAGRVAPISGAPMPLDREWNKGDSKKEKTLEAIPPNEKTLMSSNYKKRRRLVNTQAAKHGGDRCERIAPRRRKLKSPGHSNGQDLMRGENPKFGSKMGGNPPYGSKGDKELIIDQYRREEKSKAMKAQGRLTALQKTGSSKVAPGGSLLPDYRQGPDGKFGRADLHMGIAGHSPWPAMDCAGQGGKEAQTGTSIFDPVLTEIAYKWFCTPGGSILDPFSGGSTRGVVAEYLRFKYTGIELRKEQLEANERQAKAIGLKPNWICGDSVNLSNLIGKNSSYDLVFTCPPYYDLEIYSESEKDGSAFESYEMFLEWYKGIFQQATERLKNNRFFVVVVGDIRDKKGIYRNFIGDTVTTFTSLGLHYYNEIILITAVGSLPVRVGRMFTKNRKVGKAHQNILVFYKGDVEKIREIFPEEIEGMGFS